MEVSRVEYSNGQIFCTLKSFLKYTYLTNNFIIYLLNNLTNGRI